MGETFDDVFFAEGYYELAVNEFWTVTPALLYSEDDDDDSAFYGIIRSTFQF
ncbi:MAG: hypothetical protein AAFR42_10595 [Cyanobacteria bacterium J06628_6]